MMKHVALYKAGGWALGILFWVSCQFSAIPESFGQFPSLPWWKKHDSKFDSVQPDAQLIQTHPDHHDGAFRRSMTQRNAVVLIHGLRLHPFRPAEAQRSRLHGWQRPQSNLVRALAQRADVFAFAYRQTVPIQEIACLPCLVEGVAQLKRLGYDEIVLIGHSAGGLIARQFVEDYPDAGVTKVIQVCSPNSGAGYAAFNSAASKSQRPFLQSLTKEARNHFLRERSDKTIPASVDFVCVIGCGAAVGDGVVSAKSQWPADLQSQGVPAHLLLTTHYTVMRGPAEVKRIAELACGRGGGCRMLP